MKRFLGLLLLFTYLTAMMTAFADRYDDLYNYTEIVPEQGLVSADITLENLADFDYLSVFDEYIQPYSMSAIAEGIANTNMHLDINYRIQRRKIIKAYIVAHTFSPIKMNDALTIDANAVFQIWINMNFLNRDKPHYKIIVKTPLSETYFVFNSADEKAILFYPAENRIRHLKSCIQVALRENSRLLAQDKTYIVSLDDSNLKNIMTALNERSFNYLYLLFNGNSDDDERYTKYKEEIPQAMERLKNVQILGRSGILKKLVFGDNQKISESEFNLELDTNIFKLYYAATGQQLPTDPNIPRPIINAKNSDVHLKISVKMSFNDEYSEFSFPRLDDKTVHDVFKSDDYSLSYTTDEETSSPYEVIEVVNDGFLLIDNNIPYIPLRTMLNSLGVINENILWDNGTVEITDDAAPILPFSSINLSVGSNQIYSDGLLTELSLPVITKDGIICVPEDFVNKILDATILGYSTTYNYEKKIYQTVTEIERLKPVYYVQFKNSSFNIVDAGI